ARGPGPTLEYLAIAKPGGRILSIGIIHEIAWKWIEGRLRPFPDVARHLTAAKGAIAGREGSHVGAPQEACVQIGTLRRRRLIAPGIAAFAPGNTFFVRSRLGTGAQFPPSCRGRPAASPVTVCFRSIPCDVRHWRMGFQRYQRIEMLPQPALSIALPIQWVLRLSLRTPDPALITPPLLPLVATILYKRGKFRIGDGRPRHTERRDFHRMGPFFVIKHKRLVWRRPQGKSPARDCHIARQRTTAQGRRCAAQLWGRVG